MAPSELLESILGVNYILCHLFHARVLPSMATKSLNLRIMAMAVMHVYCSFTFRRQAHRLPNCLRLRNQNSLSPVLYLSRPTRQSCVF